MTSEYSQRKFRYHHGNLREALVETTLELLKTHSVQDLSLRTLAKATGVTQAAPYSHFRDKDELLTAVAETGFQRLAMQMANDAAGQKDTRARIEKLLTSYLRFAVENKPLFRLMFGRELSASKQFPTLVMTAGKSYALIAAALSSTPGLEENGADRFVSLAIWSLCQGLAELVSAGQVDPAHLGVQNLEDLVQKTIAVVAGSLF